MYTDGVMLRLDWQLELDLVLGDSVQSKFEDLCFPTWERDYLSSPISYIESVSQIDGLAERFQRMRTKKKGK